MQGTPDSDTRPDTGLRESPPADARAETTPGSDGAARPDGARAAPKPREIGGPSGPEPTRYGDWERNGRCSDF